MKKVFLEMEKLCNMNSGLGQFCFHLGKSLSLLQPLKIDPYFYVPSKQENIFGKDFHYLRQNSLHKYFKLTDKYDIWHCLHQESVYLPSKKTSKIVLTIHDLNFLEVNKHPLKQKLRLHKLQKLINKADAITVISRYTESVIRKNLKLPDIPVKVIYNGNTLKSISNPGKPIFAPNQKFLFSVGIISENKNFISLVPLLKYFEDYFLIIAGNKDHSHASDILTLATKLGVADRVILPGTITEEDKCWLYRNCTAFLFPSIAEGFGLPVIEAMSLGKPVFLSSLTSLPEVGGKEAFYFNSFEPEEMADVVKKGLKEVSVDPGKSKRTIEWAEQFSWKNSAEAYQQLYLNL